jgi:prephenate dehydrogenase
MGMVKTVGIVGYGHFGTFLHELAGRFFPDITVRVYSRRHRPDNQTFFTLPEVSQCDVVILCGAISEYESQLKDVLQYAPVETVLIDVATVKKYTSELMRTYCADRHAISTHPMFGPESYRKHGGNIAGFRIVVTDYLLPNDSYVRLKEVFTNLGFTIIEMTADEHDARLAETLFLTHYVSQSIVAAGFTRTPIDTLSFQFLMDAVESVQGDTKLFQDVYRYNPYCQQVATRLHAAQETVFKTLTP